MARRTLSELAQIAGATLVGDGSIPIEGPASLVEATPFQISFCALARYAPQLDATRAAAVVVPPELRSRRAGLPLLLHEDPNAAFTRICAVFAEPLARPAPGVHTGAHVDPSARLGADVSVGAGCTLAAGVSLGARSVLHPGVHLGAGCVLGEDCDLHPGVVLYPGVVLGARVCVHATSVLGADGFGYEPPAGPGGVWTKIPHSGRLEIGDDVEIGAGCTIDRARFGVTRIERGAKLDNQVHVGHNCVIGAGSMLAAQVGLAGSTRVGRGVLLGGQTGVGGHVHIGDGSRCAGQSGVIGDVAPGSDLWGTPARPRREVLRSVAELRRLGELRRRLEQIERRLGIESEEHFQQGIPMTRMQRTLRTAVEFSGVGLHSGQTVRARILPAPQGTGVEFVRTDLEDAAPIPARIQYRVTGDRRTRLRRGQAEVETIEHLLAACHGMQIDNATVEMDGPEMPGMDGSAAPFVELFDKAGIAEQRAEVKTYRLEQPIYVRDEQATIVALPSERANLTLQYIAAFDEPGVEGGSFQVDVEPETFRRQIAGARTFCLATEVPRLLEAGLGKGASRENTVVLGDPDTVLRMPGEPVRHKLLDLMGDLFLLGASLQAHVIATRSGHASNAELVRRLLDLMQADETGGLVQRESGLDIREVMKMLPHRYPFLLIDRVIEMEGYQRAVAIKNVSINEPFFSGHFPEVPLFPGVLQLEAIAQLAGVLLLRKLEHTGKLAALWSIDKVKLRGSVVPGDQLRIEVETIRMKGETAQVRGAGFVAGKLVCEATLMFTLMEP